MEAGRIPVCSDCLADVEGWGPELRCGQCQREVSHGDSLDAAGACGACRRRPGSLQRVWTYGPYRGALRGLIHLLKFDGMQPLGDVLGERAASCAELAEEADLIVPVPLHWTRRWKRGFNQSGLIARVVSRRHGVRCEPRALRRRKRTRPQAGLSGAQRRESLRGTIEARRSCVEGKRVLLVDDVVTTGATIEVCARALRKVGARRVTALAAARAELEHRMI